EARSICWTVWAREISCWLTAPTTPTLCVRRSRNAAPGRASNQYPDAWTLRLSGPFVIVTETSPSASSTHSSTSAPSPRDTTNPPTTASLSSGSLPAEYGCDLMSMCLSLLCEVPYRSCPRRSGNHCCRSRRRDCPCGREGPKRCQQLRDRPRRGRGVPARSLLPFLSLR